MKETTVIEAAGGLLWRDTPEGKQIAIIHRPRYDDWTLPKGKLEEGEAWEQAALREVREETGYKVVLGEFAGSTTYRVGSSPKVVLFWHMSIGENSVFTASNEVDELRWLSPKDGFEVLSYELEKELLIENSKHWKS